MNTEMNQSKAILNLVLKRGTGFVMILILLLLGLRGPMFFRFDNLMDVLKQGSVLTLVALAFNLVLIPGGFDMCAGATTNFTCNISALLVLSGVSGLISIPVGIAVGALVGLFNALVVVGMRLPAFIGTLGSMYIVQGLTAIVNKGDALTIKQQGLFTMLGQGGIAGIPVLFIITVAICAILHYFLKHTATGLRIYASGENPHAAQQQGVNPKKYLVIGFILSGALLGLAGVLRCSYANGASALNTTFEYLVKAIIAAYLGTTFSKTGELSVIGTVISGIFIAALNNVLIINSISDQIISGILGVILILSILITVIKKRDVGQVTLF